ncbi:MAG: hypothetical protein C9356_14520 [Oleiphilus sp.]|nr:MAG: hypothetical protein C9356_14520 [Oleiphilus sp.]
MHFNLAKFIQMVALCACIMVPATGWSRTIEETPSALAMTGDAIVVRPVMLATTLIGAGIFIVSSPFSALGGNVGEAFDVLVKGPFETTFVRCLGCTMNGRKVSDVVEQTEESDTK